MAGTKLKATDRRLVNVHLSNDDLDGALATLSHIRNGARNALMRGINKTLVTIRARIARRIQDEVLIKSKDIKKYITAKNARKDALYGTVVLEESERIPLKYFGAKDNHPRGVSYRITEGGKRPKIHNAFIIQKFGGHVFLRGSKKRGDLRKPMGVSPWGTFVKNEMIRPIDREAESELTKKTLAEVNYLMLKAAGKIKQRAK